MHITIYNEGSNGATVNGGSQPLNYPFNGEELFVGGALQYHPARTSVNLIGCDRIRLSSNVFYFQGSGTIQLLYSIDNGATWDDTGASLTIAGAGLQDGVYANLPAAAQGEVWLAISTSLESGAQFYPYSITADAD